jgi:catalase
MGTLAEQAVEAVRGVYGRHGGYRAVHAKGVFCTGRFTPTPEAARLTSAPHMQGGAVEVTTRFSNASGRPDVSDASRDARGLAVKFHLRDGRATDLLATNVRRFYSRTPEDFVAFTRAAAGPAAPLKLVRFLVRHSETVGVLAEAARHKPPESYATTRYNSLHTFRWVDPQGRRHNLRYRWRPAAGESFLAVRDAKRRGRDFLRAELGERLRSGPIEFDLQLIMAAEGDPLDDPNRAWPEGREIVTAGRLELTQVVEDPEEDGSVVVFDPTRVLDGIELSADPVLAFRPRAYSVSVDSRVRVNPAP